MKPLIIIFAISFLSMIDLVAQVNPLGVYVDIDGKIKFWTFEANRNGQVDDTVYVTFNGDIQLNDLRNLKYDYLTILEAPGDDWTSPSNLDPSKINDTIGEIISYNNINPFVFKPICIPFISSVDPQTNKYKNASYSKQNHFNNDIRGDGINDSVVNLVKARLVEYMNRYYGKFLPDDANDELRTELSLPDTVMAKIAVYDYLVDLFVTYDYDQNDRLTRVIGYHWDSGVEIDCLKYDADGNLIYFSRQHIGSKKDEFCFEYDADKRVIEVTHTNSYAGNSDENSFVNPDIRKMKFSYNESGIINSKSELQNEGNWITSYFKIN